jgi:hypothetical protein
MLTQRPARALLGSILVCAMACTGQVSDVNPPGMPGNGGTSVPGTGGSSPPAPPPPPSNDNVFFKSAVRRLTKTELRQTILDLTGLDLATEIAKFPEDYAEANDVFAFDNRYTLQQPSAALIEAAKNLADAVAAKIQADPAAARRLVGCTPKAAVDDACLRTFVQSFGRRVLRRPLATAEVDAYVTHFRPFAMEANDFYEAAGLSVRALLQDMEFLYRVEVGQPVTGQAGLFKLGGYEMATRLSYFLWGTTPDDALLDAAGSLATPDGVRTQATRMLADPRAVRAVGKFHGMWFGYERQPPPAPLTKPMLDETSALLERVIFKDKRPWLDLFRSKETYVDATLAAHYGIAAPAGGSGWVSYGATGRQGILSHGTFLGVERKHDDTSPTMRGQFVRTRLMCQVVPPPPPNLGVDIDAAPTDGNCKSDRYSMWKRPGCNACHELMDPIGHGLEGYDRVGKARAIAPADVGKAGCEITGDGDLKPAGTFHGVAGLADKLLESKVLESCLSTQLASYYLGREVRTEEQELFGRVAARFASGGYRFDQMLMDFVTLPGFGYRVAE